MTDQKVFCIVVTYNGMRWLEQHISSIKSSSYPVQAVFIDNGSTDGTVEYIQTHFQEAHLIKAQENLGFGKANNLGVDYAISKGAEFVFLLNQDAYFQDSTITTCLAGFDRASDQVALISPVHLNGDGSKLDMGFQRCITEELCPGYVSDLALGKAKPTYPIYSVNAAAWLLKVEVIKKIGLFSEAFFHYGEDINFQQRLKFFGYQALLVSNAFILHDREERNGEKSELGKQIEIHTNQMSILMNINEPYAIAIKRIWKYAGLLFFEGKISKGIALLIDTYRNKAKYQKWREEMKKGLGL